MICPQCVFAEMIRKVVKDNEDEWRRMCVVLH